MMKTVIQVQKWSQPDKPTEAEIRQLMAAEGLRPYRWQNGPHDVYAAHEHDFHKVLYVVQGSITFGFPIDGAPTTLKVGDRLDLPPHIMHNAAVGPDGVVCLEARRD